MTKPEIRFLGDLQRLELKPGDRFILSAPETLSRQQTDYIQTIWKEFVGGDTEKFKLLILVSGMKIGVINGGADE